MVIGITGVRRSGKDTAAQVFVENGYELIRFADPLKNMLRALLGNAAMTIKDIESIIEGSEKETTLSLLCGKSGRYAMQTLGTEWGRNLIGSDLWVNIAMERAKQHRLVVIPDVRFPNEAKAVRAVGGKIIKIHRPTLTWVDSHVSEQEIAGIREDYLINNNADIELLHIKIKELCQNQLSH